MVNKDLKKNSKIRTVNMMIQSALIIILIVLVANMMVEIKNLQGTARVINYAGLVRGATQRAVKLEVIGNSDDELIEYLDDVLADLKYEDGEYNLVSLRDTDYQKKLDIQIDYWGKLKNEINNVRENGAKVCILQKDSVKDKLNVDEIKKKYSNRVIILVEDTIRAIQQIAEYKRSLYDIPVVGITGSVGKTSTKDIISSVMAKKYNVLKTLGNFNSQIGLPLTVLRLKEDNNAMVVEMGMSAL